MTMTLHWSPRSPFVRKVMIVLHETGQLEDVKCIRSVVAATLPPNPAVLADNPLAKIPTLVTDTGMALFDSRLICEFLDHRAGGHLSPPHAAAHMAQLRWQALGDGLMDILLVWRTELTRPEGAWNAVTDGWQVKVRSCLHWLDADSGALASAPFGIGHVAIICALGQLDFRWPDCDWRRHFPKLAGLEASWATRSSVQATAIRDDSTDGNEVTRGKLTFAPG